MALTVSLACQRAALAGGARAALAEALDDVDGPDVFRRASSSASRKAGSTCDVRLVGVEGRSYDPSRNDGPRR
jgi:hypothetical protein